MENACWFLKGMAVTYSHSLILLDSHSQQEGTKWNECLRSTFHFGTDDNVSVLSCHFISFPFEVKKLMTAHFLSFFLVLSYTSHKELMMAGLGKGLLFFVS